jgi:DNA-binding beta-propeller fold protein YncE
MKWITRERPKIDRVACPWLIARFIDQEPEFLFIPPAEVRPKATTLGATPYDARRKSGGLHHPMTKIRLFTRSLALGCSLIAATANAASTDVLQLKQTIPLAGVEGRIDHMAVDATLGRLYVAAIGNNTVEVVDLAAGRRVATLTGLQEPQGIAVIPGSHRIVIASGGDNKCRIYDQSLKLIAYIDDLEDADNVRFNPKTGQAMVGYGRGALAFIDPQAGIKIAEIKLDGHPESFQLAENGDRIFVNVPGAGHVAVAEGDKRVVTAKWSTEGAKKNFPMAFDEAGHRLFIGCRQPAKLLVLDSDTGKTVASLDIVGNTDDVFYDRALNRIYVTGSKGSITVIQRSAGDQYTALASVPVGEGAQSSLFVPDTGTLYVAIPHRGSQGAHIAVFATDAKARNP